MSSIGFGNDVCGRLEQGSTREWLVPDGRGGYAMGTVSGLRTRRYHGLLIVADPSSASRFLGLASLDPFVTLPSGKTVALGVHEWTSGTVDPTGHLYLEHFDLTDGLPRWRWRIGDLVIERELAMAHGRAELTVEYRLLAGGPVTLTQHALCTWRDSHGERTAVGPEPTVIPVDGGAVIDGAYRLDGPG
ncbi:MAG: glycogen debranching enzyme N-terminal domain-containing protein, partial [Longispora sp.]|nr:glycogen debranching enzyme N-terminal domain-containing protein [Longispora sp. (in: high G+C Gram-positive bacteria)]